jgi:hypothetical protein
MIHSISRTAVVARGQSEGRELTGTRVLWHFSVLINSNRDHATYSPLRGLSPLRDLGNFRYQMDPRDGVQRWDISSRPEPSGTYRNVADGCCDLDGEDELLDRRPASGTVP